VFTNVLEDFLRITRDEAVILTCDLGNMLATDPAAVGVRTRMNEFAVLVRRRIIVRIEGEKSDGLVGPPALAERGLNCIGRTLDLATERDLGVVGLLRTRTNRKLERVRTDTIVAANFRFNAGDDSDEAVETDGADREAV
jgi:hypothetical protein